jgi:hypothetical protein
MAKQVTRAPQVFALQPLANGQGYFCYNDVFRLNYG